MKYIWVLILFCRISFAVDIEQCPLTIHVYYEKLNALTRDEMIHRSAQAFQDQQVLLQAEPREFQRVKLNLFERSLRQCRYLPEQQRSLGYNETRIFSLRDRDVLRVVLKIDGRHYWILHNLAFYSPRGLRLADFNPAKILGVIHKGSARVQLGWAELPLVE